MTPPHLSNLRNSVHKSWTDTVVLASTEDLKQADSESYRTCFIPNILFSPGRNPNKKVCWHADQPLTQGNVSFLCGFGKSGLELTAAVAPSGATVTLRVMSKQSYEALCTLCSHFYMDDERRKGGWNMAIDSYHQEDSPLQLWPAVSRNLWLGYGCDSAHVPLLGLRDKLWWKHAFLGRSCKQTDKQTKLCKMNELALTVM